MSRQAGLDCSGEFKAAPDIRQNGPAAGGGYVLRAGQKVKVAGTAGLADPFDGGGTGSVKMKDRSGGNCGDWHRLPILLEAASKD
jgi:hypothetical protein